MRNVSQGYTIFPECWEIKRMRKQCVPGTLSSPLKRLGTKLACHNVSQNNYFSSCGLVHIHVLYTSIHKGAGLPCLLVPLYSTLFNGILGEAKLIHNKSHKVFSRANTTAYQSSFFLRSLALWNILPEDNTSCTKLNIFKQTISNTM